jgi:hypothetical protein
MGVPEIGTKNWNSQPSFCALLFTLFGEGCDLYQSMFEILLILSHLFCGQNKLAYTPEVCRQITWAIVFNYLTSR